MNAPAPRCYAFGRFHLDPLRGRLSNGGTAIELRPKSLAVLHYLVAHPQRMVGKDELLAAVWGKVVVTEDSLVQCVREIRQALGDTEQRIVRTIPRAGYLFVADVAEEMPLLLDEPGDLPPMALTAAAGAAAPAAAPRRSLRWVLGSIAAASLVVGAGLALLRMDEASTQPAAPAAGAAAVPALSIAVLPLANIGGDAEHEYFAQGLSNDLATDLGRLPGGLVISPNSLRDYRGRAVDGAAAGRELGARYVIEGSVQRLGEEVRVTLRLVESAGGAQRWAERFEAPRNELSRLQVDIVRAIARTLELRVLEAEAERSVRERTRDLGAQDLVLHGWALWERRRGADNAQARVLFSRALEADAQFSLAWVGLANTHLADLHAGWSDDRQAALEQASRALERAYAVGPRHRDVNASRGYVHFFQGDIEAALAAFERELGTNPGHALAHVWRGLMLISLGRPAEALASIERGIQLSPRDVDLHVFYRSMAHAWLSLGRYAEAKAWSQKAVGHTPAYAKGQAFLAAAAALQGDTATAATAATAFRRLQPQYPSVADFRRAMMPGEVHMFDATPRFWEGLEKAGLPRG